MREETPLLPRALLAEFFGKNLRLMQGFEQVGLIAEETSEAVASTVAATDSLQDATVLVLSANGAFTNERVLTIGSGIEAVDNGMTLTLRVKGDVARTEDFGVKFIPPGEAILFLPIEGTLATREGEEMLEGKTLVAPRLATIPNYANDAAAAAGGVEIAQVYRNGSVLMVRVA
ncbi:MAG: hypothetical protein V4696_00735 [Pseudomonadota bacterium]